MIAPVPGSFNICIRIDSQSLLGSYPFFRSCPGNLEELLEIHSRFNAAMKKRQKEDPMMEKVGDILVNMVSNRNVPLLRK